MHFSYPIHDTVTLSSPELSIRVSSLGAELQSIVAHGHEYLWQGDPRFWARRSPILFPNVGRLWNNEFHYHGETFSLSQHGFARDCLFHIIDQSVDSVWFELRSDPATLSRYPFPFRLRIGYTLCGYELIVSWYVFNTGTSEMFFQIGGHPGFFLPGLAPSDTLGVTDVDFGYLGWLRFFRYGLPAPSSLYTQVVGEQGCADPALSGPLALSEGAWLPVRHSLFDRDAIIIPDSQVDTVQLCYPDQRPYLSLSFKAPLVGIWSPPAMQAPFLCIEPWYGRCDRVGFTGDIARRDHICRLAPSRAFHSQYIIRIH